MASCTWDDPCTGLWCTNSSTVGRYPHPSGEASTGIISSISWLFVKSDVLMLMQKLWRQLMHSRTSAAVLNDTPNGCFKSCHLVVSNPKAISILILTWLKKKLYASFVGSDLWEPVKGVRHLSVRVYAASPTMYAPRGKSSKTIGSTVRSIAAWSDDFPGAATAKKVKWQEASQMAWTFSPWQQ